MIDIHAKTRVAAILMLGVVAGCSGGGASSGSLPSAVGGALATQSEAQIITPELQAEQIQQTPAASSSDLLYVANTGNNSITVYRNDAQGNSAPLRTISGPKTGITSPGQLSQDAQGNLYVANGNLLLPNSASPAILVFAHDANGNAAPIRKLAGPSTGLHNVEAMTVDQVTGKMFVLDSQYGNGGMGGGLSLRRFPPRATGNMPPFAAEFGLSPATELASDSTGKNIVEAHAAGSPNVLGNGISTVDKQFANNGQLHFIYSVDGMYASGIADDPTTKTYLVASTFGTLCTAACGIYRLKENTVGFGPLELPQTLTPAPVSIITSDTCGTQLALGYLRNIFVTHGIQTGCPSDAVYVYAHDASGNATPLRVLSGPATGLSAPYGIYEGR